MSATMVGFVLMTAEIAVMNKTAVALAADSAVTIGSGGSAKIFNTVDKIFEVSEKNPIGIMISNRLDFMDLPLEVVIKEFRRKSIDLQLPTVADWKCHFLSYLQNDVSYSSEDQSRNHRLLIRSALEQLGEKYTYMLPEIVRKRGLARGKINYLVETAAKLETNRLIAIPFAAGFEKPVRVDGDRELVEEMTPSILELFGVKLSRKALTALCRYISLYLSKAEMSQFSTGFVFAGFGQSELCPSLCHVEIDGIVDGKLKIREVREVDIGRSGPDAAVVGFAQDDMVQSFVHGVDPSFREYVAALLEQVIMKTADMIAKPILHSDELVKRLLRGLRPHFEQLAGEYRKKSDEFVERFFTRQVEDMVRAMPKQELATLAQSLIEITSLKRKVTRQRETVGGDVDVALISRSEGLVWIRRKHYFPAELNSRFLARRYVLGSASSNRKQREIEHDARTGPDAPE